MIELEPLDALALSLHHAPGIYALLVGSGLSRSAGIPTGWEITLDLISKLGALEGISHHDDWAAWFRAKHGNDPNYSEILDALAATQSERRAILHSYIEPREGEDARRPTKAHHAIAKFVLDGAVRVIITTNFDRLIESALRDIGIEPTVIASEDALAGSTPLVHSRCTVIKVHGDYLDTRIKNTDGELGTYSPGINALLDEVFDKFGLIVVGWSGEWDSALRTAILRSPNRRYEFYWAARGALAPLAADLIRHRAGRSFSITDADGFFTRLGDLVDALRRAEAPNPKSIAMALALAKQYCRDDRYSLEWAEFLTGEVSKIKTFIAGPTYPRDSPTPASLNALIGTLATHSETLRRCCLISGRWGTPEANRSVARAIRALTTHSQPVGYQWWGALGKFPASICFYYAIAGALARNDFSIVHTLMHWPTKGANDNSVFVTDLPLLALISSDWKWLAGLEQRHTPASDFVFSIFEGEAGDAAIDPSDTEDLFDQTEFLISAESGHMRLEKSAKTGWWFHAPIGRFIWKHPPHNPAARLSGLENLPPENDMLRSGLLGGTPASANNVVNEMRKFFGHFALMMF